MPSYRSCSAWLTCILSVLAACSSGNITGDDPGNAGNADDADDAGQVLPGDPDAAGSTRIDAGATADARPGVADARPVPDARPDPEPEPDAEPPDDDGLEWRTANLTNFTSYPEPGSEECEDFSGCKWAGLFSFLSGQQSESWVMSHNIAAVHSDFGDEYALKTLRLRYDGEEIDVTVYDECADSDCSGCCTRNMSETGFLIDIESYTAERFGLWDGIVEWACLDC